MSSQGGVKFPYLIETRKILWFYEVLCWGYWWGMTEAQVDLLLMDQPTVTYKKSKKGGKNAPSAKKVREAEEKWKEKYSNGEKPKLNINLNDFSI